jgi:hypothetical protein
MKQSTAWISIISAYTLGIATFHQVNLKAAATAPNLQGERTKIGYASIDKN